MAVAILRSLKGRCHGNEIYRQNRRFGATCFHLSHWHYEKDWNIGTQISRREAHYSYIMYKFGDVWCGNSGVHK